MNRLFNGTILGGGLCDKLNRVPQALKNRVHFSAHLQWFKGYFGSTDLIKKQSIGVA